MSIFADHKNGLRVINASIPTNPVQIGDWNCFAFAVSIEVEGDYAYVAPGFDGVRIYNMSNPANPVEVGTYLVDGLIYTLKLSGTRLYAGTFLNSPEKRPVCARHQRPNPPAEHRLLW